MEYSDLVEALQENDTSRVNEYMETLVPRLIRFLRIHMNASRADAEDCAQETILVTLEAISSDRIKKPERILSYILTTCKNNYLKMKVSEKEENYEKVPNDRYHEPGQFNELLTKERKAILEWCMKQLKEEYRQFMNFWFLHPDYEAKEVAEEFNISVSNTWTRKHRLIKELNKCYEEKSEL